MSDSIAQIEKLADLKEKGILTAEEFNAKKQELLNIPSTGTATVLTENEQAKVSNVAIWFLAFAPLLGLFLEYLIAGAVLGERKGIRAVEAGNFFLVTVALNVILAIKDEKALKKAGYDTSKFSWSTWIVPVYLFQRSTLLKQNKATFIVWLIMFILILL